MEANREIYHLLRDGVKVRWHADDGDETVETVRVIDWDDPDQQRLLPRLAVLGHGRDVQAPRRPGGLRQRPAAGLHRAQGSRTSGWRHAFDDNLRDYKATIPQLFWYNALIILSNGSAEQDRQHHAPSGSTSPSGRRSTARAKQGVVSLETMLRGTCEPARLLDLVENFTLFDGGNAAG